MSNRVVKKSKKSNKCNIPLQYELLGKPDDLCNNSLKKNQVMNTLTLGKVKLLAKSHDLAGTIIRYEEENERLLLRKKQLFDQLTNNKLEYTKNGICDSFIKFGKPELNIVIKDVQKRTEVQSKRLTKLLNRLRKEDETYDENISYYKKYIKYGGDLDYHVDEGIKEWFYVNKTKYLEFLKIYKDEDRAQANAFNNYIKTVGHDKYTERICQTEMIIRLY